MFDAEYSPRDFDVLLSDVHSNDLHHVISDRLYTSYLGNAEEGNFVEAAGIVWGSHNRVFVATVVKRKDMMKHVHFLVDTGSPYTFMCEEALKSLHALPVDPVSTVRVHINGHAVLVHQSPKDKHFNDINVLGTDFMKTYNCILNVDFGESVATLTLDQD